MHELQQIIICNQSLFCRDGGQAISSAVKKLHEASVRMEKMLSDLTAAQQQQQDERSKSCHVPHALSVSLQVYMCVL